MGYSEFGAFFFFFYYDSFENKIKDISRSVLSLIDIEFQTKNEFFSTFFSE